MLGFRLIRGVPRAAAFSAAVIGWCLATPALAQQPTSPASLSLEEAVSLALQNNPDLLAQRNELHTAGWAVRSAYGDFLPSVNASSSLGYTAPGERRVGSVALGEQPAYYSSGYNLGLTYSLSGAKLMQPSIARAQERATGQRVEGAEAGLVADVAQRYLSALQARESIAQAEREVARTVEHVRLAQARLDVGAGTALDVRRAEVQQGQAEIRLLQARNAQANEVLALGQLLAVPLSPDVELVSDFDLAQPQLDAEALVQVALRNNPVLRATQAQAEAAGVRFSAARTSYLPTVNFSMGLSGSVFQAGNLEPLVAGQFQQTQRDFNACQQQNQVRQLIGEPLLDCSQYNLADPGVEQRIRERVRAQNTGFPFDYRQQPLSASMSISLPVFTGLTRQQQVEEARIASRNAQHQVHSQELRLRTEVNTAVRNAETAYRAALLQSRVRETAAEELRLAQERFRFGAASSVEVTDAQTSLSEAERAEINAIYDYHKSLAALEALVGQPLR